MVMRLFRRKRSGALSLKGGLALLLGRRQYKVVCDRGRGNPDLLRYAADVLGISEEHLMVRLADLMGLTVKFTLPPADLNALAGILTFEDLREAGASLASCDGQPAALFCVDPGKGSEIMQFLERPMPLYLSTFSAIARSLDEGQKSFIAKEKQKESDCRQQLERCAEEVLQIIISEARHFKAREVEIASEESQLVYRFKTSDQRLGKGGISAQVQSSVLSLLHRINSGGEKWAGFSSAGKWPGTFSVAEVARGEFRVFWREAAVDSQQPPHLPVVADKDAGLATQPASAKPALKSRNILLVEDNVLFARTVARFLERHDLDVTRQTSAAATLAALEKGELRPDLVLCDLHMPDVNGFQFLKATRMLAAGRSLPVIMLTSDNDAETEVQALSAGADAFVSKQEHPRILLAHVRRHLSKHNQKGNLCL